MSSNTVANPVARLVFAIEVNMRPDARWYVNVHRLVKRKEPCHALFLRLGCWHIAFVVQRELIDKRAMRRRSLGPRPIE